jgi:NADP-dependent 3-hydroxy acid dehydrogenase YdfG
MVFEAWRRRWWRPDREALAAFSGLRPMVVVTGGSEGIGYELARRFARDGHDVMLVARRAEPLKQAAARIRTAFGVEALAVPADVTAPGATAAIDAALAAHGAYADVLVNSAGIGLAGPFHAQSPDDLTRLIDLNVRALTQLMRHYLPGMRLRVVVPGLLNPFLALALKLLPHRLMVPFIAWLLKPRTTRPH